MMANSGDLCTWPWTSDVVRDVDFLQSCRSSSSSSPNLKEELLGWSLFHFFSNRNISGLPSCLYLSHLFLFKSLPFFASLVLLLPFLFTATSLEFITFYTCLVILNDGLWTMKFCYKLSSPSVSAHNLVMRHQVVPCTDIRVFQASTFFCLLKPKHGLFCCCSAVHNAELYGLNETSFFT